MIRFINSISFNWLSFGKIIMHSNPITLYWTFIDGSRLVFSPTML
jgi:hypothetical protein